MCRIISSQQIYMIASGIKLSSLDILDFELYQPAEFNLDYALAHSSSFPMEKETVGPRVQNSARFQTKTERNWTEKIGSEKCARNILFTGLTRIFFLFPLDNQTLSWKSADVEG